MDVIDIQSPGRKEKGKKDGLEFRRARGWRDGGLEGRKEIS